MTMESAKGILKRLALKGLRQELETMMPLVRQVMRQTRERIFRGNTRAEDKLFSVFEPSTEIIRKGKAGKPNEFGKMVKLQEAENQIVIDYEVYDRRPSDSDLLVPAIEIHQAKLGRTPRLVAADAGFYSAKNEGRIVAIVDVEVAEEPVCSGDHSHPRPQDGSFSSCPSHENSAHADPSRVP